MPLDTLLFLIPGDHPPLPIFEKMVRLNGSASGVYYACQRPNYFPEHTNPHIQILVPFEGTSIQASWQTASGQRKQQHVKQGHVTILPANLPREMTNERQVEAIVISSIYYHYT